MLKAKRTVLGLAFAGWLGLSGLNVFDGNRVQAAAPPERIYPETTLFMGKVADAKALRQAFQQSQYGQLWNDPAMADFRADLREKLQDAGKEFKQRFGLSLKELLEIPQGHLAVGIIPREDPKLPFAILFTAEAGQNAAKLTDVMTKGTKQSEQFGAKVSTETFQGNPIHIIELPEPKDDNKNALEFKHVCWTYSKTTFFIGTDLDAIKDLVSNVGGRENSLASNDSFSKTQSKVGAENAQITWFLDLNRIVKLGSKVASKGVDAQLQQTEFFIQELGLNGLKSVGGSLTLGSGRYDSLTKTFFLAPSPVTGLLKIFSLPKTAIQPEPWVPSSIASYQSLSIDLKNIYKGINDLIDKFQPGMLQALQQQLVGPEGGEPLNIEKEVFGPLGDRVSVITDFKKPVKEDSQRTLMAIALKDSKTFQSTFAKVLALASASPKKREFQGTTIYDFEVNLPNMPNNPNAANVQFKGPLSVAIAKDTFFATSDTTLLEQILRPGNGSLAESPEFQSVRKEMPEKISGMTYVRPEEQARISYDMLKNGTFEKAMQQAAARGRGNGAEPPKLMDTSKLPDFSVFAKYLSKGGSYSQMEEDGFIMTGFSLKKTNP
jgi:hypothetical protein